MLKRLPESALLLLLKILNKIWFTGESPLSWFGATIIPIPNPGKDPSDLGSYRPIALYRSHSNKKRLIALTSCVCKTLELIINDRLVCFLRKNKLFSKYQSGFWKQYSTTDQFTLSFSRTLVLGQGPTSHLFQTETL